MYFCKVIRNINSTGLWITLLPEAKFQSLCCCFLNTKVKKNAVIIEHAVKAMKEKGVHLKTSNFECKPLIGNFFEEIFSILHVYLYTQSPSEYADR